MTGALAQAPSLALIRQRYPDLTSRLPVLAPCLKAGAPDLSYTQWEAWLALYHGKTLLIAVPEEGAQRAAQHDHLARLAEVERYPEIRFATADRLAVGVLRSKLHEILVRAGVHIRPTNLLFRSLGELFKGRAAAIDELGASLGSVPAQATPVVARVINGIGGVGKTRFALEYAWRRADDYRALLGLHDPPAGAGCQSPSPARRSDTGRACCSARCAGMGQCRFRERRSGRAQLAAARPAVAAYADEAGISDPTTRLLNDTGLLYTKALYADAEPLLRRALRIFVASLGSEHPNSQRVRGNTIALLQAMDKGDDEIADCLASDFGE